MKSLFILLLPLFSMFSMRSLNPGKAAQVKRTIVVPNPTNDRDSKPNLQAAVSSAQDGDEVILPSGHFVINKNIVITKFVSIKGQGLSNTILYRSESIPDKVLSTNIDWDGILKFDIY
ncbi:MAG: hypothetical protein ACRDE8_04025 [Ginsengibacter sp.]